MVNMEVVVAGIKFKNPVMNAAGPNCKDGRALKMIAEGGAGGLVAKTISVVPAKVPRPCMAMVDRDSRKGMVNVELWSDLPYEQWLKEEYRMAKATGLPLIASMGYKAEEVGKLAPLVEKAGADGIECSVHYLGSDPKPIIDVVKAVKEASGLPLFIKLSPHGYELADFAKAAEKAGADGIVAINSLGPCLHIDIETARPYLGGKSGYGWLSGSPIKPLAVRCVADIARAVKIPVVGVGGISSGRDAAEHIMAGASAVQICTAAILQGPKIYGKVAKELEEFMKSHGYDSVEDMKGLALKHLPEESNLRKVTPVVDEERCTGCGTCVKTCVYEAITVGKKKKAVVDEGKCYGCGMCVSVCPFHALEIKL